MASITVRNLDDDLKERLRRRSARHRRSMEEEAREILRTTLAREQHTPPNLAASIRRRLSGIGGIDLAESLREAMPEPPDLGQ